MRVSEVSVSGRRSRWRREENDTKNEVIQSSFCRNNNKTDEKDSDINHRKLENDNHFNILNQNNNNNSNNHNKSNHNAAFCTSQKMYSTTAKTKWSSRNSTPLFDLSHEVSLQQKHSLSNEHIPLGAFNISAPSGQKAISFSSSSSSNRSIPSSASHFAIKALRSQIAMCDPQLFVDMQKALEGGSIYIPGFFCNENDFTIYRQLEEDIKKEEAKKKTGTLVKWSKHLKLENPEFSDTFNRMLKRMEEYFDVTIYATRLNYYSNGNDWKPFHHDSHAYITTKNDDTAARAKNSNSEGDDNYAKKLSEDFTMGGSFGASRQLVFLHEKSTQQFAFPQKNGDVFAFTSLVNKSFKHGVPKETNHINKIRYGPPDSKSNEHIEGRFSIIAWGKRNSLNERNAGLSEIKRHL